MEILAIGLMRTLPLDGRQPEDVACDVLEEFVRARQQLGQPVPALPTDIAASAHHTCPPKNRDGVTQ